MHLTSIVLTICLMCSDGYPIKDDQKPQYETNSYGVLEFNIDDELVEKFFEDKATSRERNYTTDNSEVVIPMELSRIIAQNAINNIAESLRQNLARNNFGSSQTNSQIVGNQNRGNLISPQDGVVVSVAIPQMGRFVANGVTNDATNDFTNGVTNGFTNGATNGVTNGFTNGVTNGVSNGVSTATNNPNGDDQNGQIFLQNRRKNMDRIRFSVPENAPVVIQLKDSMIVNRKVKKIERKPKEGFKDNGRNLHITW